MLFCTSDICLLRTFRSSVDDGDGDHEESLKRNKSKGKQMISSTTALLVSADASARPLSCCSALLCCILGAVIWFPSTSTSPVRWSVYCLLYIERKMFFGAGATASIHRSNTLHSTSMMSSSIQHPPFFIRLVLAIRASSPPRCIYNTLT